MNRPLLLLALAGTAAAFHSGRVLTRPASRLHALDGSLLHLGETAAQLAHLPQLLLGDDPSTSAAVQEVTYSKTSYYTTLALYALSFPGLLSQIRRSVKPDPKTKVFEIPGPEAEPAKALGLAARTAAEKAREEGLPPPVMTVGGKPMRETAAEIVAYFQANNYEVASADDAITFRGLAGRSKSQAFFLTFITFLGLGSLGLVLSIQFPFGGNYWYALTLLAPYAGVYYWQNASIENNATVRLETSDDGMTTDIVVRAEKEELDRFQESLGYSEKGMVYVKSIFDREGDGAQPAVPEATDAPETPEESGAPEAQEAPKPRPPLPKPAPQPIPDQRPARDL